MSDETPSGPRASWGSRIGYILAAAGSTVGLGAIWKFPYVVAQHGGGAFLVVFLAIAATVGVSLMIAETSFGATVSNGAVGAFRKFAGRFGSFWGYMHLLTAFLILSYYSVVGGWTIAYFVKMAGGSLDTSDAGVLSASFSSFIAEPWMPIFYHALFMGATGFVVFAGVQKGIERMSRSLMTTLFLLMMLLIVRGLTLDGALDGVVAYFSPDFSKLTGEAVVDALGLVFFSLSLGSGIMVIYGSYIPKDAPVIRPAVSIIGITVTVNFLAALMILPMVHVFGVSSQAGPGLTFIAMPAIFSQMPGGMFFGLAFFALLFVASLTSSVSLLEGIVAMGIDEWKWSRGASVLVSTVSMFALGCVASLSMGILGGYRFFGKNFFGILDFTAANLMMPICSLAASVVIGFVAWKAVRQRIGLREGSLAAVLFRFCLRWIAPAVILTILFFGLN